MRGTSSTIAAGPHTKHSVSGVSINGASRAGVMRPCSPRHPSASRVAVSASSQPPLPRVAPQLGQVGEVARRAGAVEEMETAALPGLVGVADHRAQRRDPGAPRHEQEVALFRPRRKDEPADRPLDHQPGAPAQRREVRTPGVRLHLQQELEPPVRLGLFRGRGDRIGIPRGVTGGAEQRRLSGSVREPGSLEGEPDDPRRRRRAPDAHDGEGERGQGVQRFKVQGSGFWVHGSGFTVHPPVQGSLSRTSHQEPCTLNPNLAPCTLHPEPSENPRGGPLDVALGQLAL